MKRFLPHLTSSNPETPRIDPDKRHIKASRLRIVLRSFEALHYNLWKTAPETLNEMMRDDAASRAGNLAGTLVVPAETQEAPRLTVVPTPVSEHAEQSPDQVAPEPNSVTALRNLVDSHSVPTSQMQLNQINDNARYEEPHHGQRAA